MSARLVLSALMVIAYGATACGGNPLKSKGLTQLQETEGRHCTDNSECPSGMCNDGRCGG